MKTKLGKVVVLITLFLLVAPWVSVMDRKRSRTVYRILLAGVCIAVCCITLLFRSAAADRTALLVPFFTYTEAFDALSVNLAHYGKDGILTRREMLLAFSYSYQSIGLNILLFVPFGYLLKTLSERKSWMWVILQGVLFSLLIECIQYTFCLGWFDIDDIINNTLGTCTGCISSLSVNRLPAKVQAFSARKDQRNRDKGI